jgi:hypothetical protein
MDPTVTVGCLSPVEKHCLKCDLVELSGLNYLQNLGFFSKSMSFEKEMRHSDFLTLEVNLNRIPDLLGICDVALSWFP